jgi:hypothetical protein
MVEHSKAILQRAGWKNAMFEEIYFAPSDVKEEHAEYLPPALDQFLGHAPK